MSTAMVNHYYFYGVDRDFGPFFVKLGSYFPYTGKVCLNGHEYLKRQLLQEGIVFEALDNGLLSCADPVRAQQICEELSAEKIEAFVRKWLRRLPHPFTAEDRQARYLYDISMLQAEFSLTQVFDRPVQGRIFFEQVIRDNLDLGRPDRVQLVFQRRITKKTPGRFRTPLSRPPFTPSRERGELAITGRSRGTGGGAPLPGGCDAWGGEGSGERGSATAPDPLLVAKTAAPASDAVGLQ